MHFINWLLELMGVFKGLEPINYILIYYGAFKKYTWAYHQIECLLPFINTQNSQQLHWCNGL